MTTKQVSLNIENYNEEEQDMVKALASRRLLAGVVEAGLRRELQEKRLPIVQQAAEDVKSALEAME